MTEATAPSAKACAVAAIADSACMALVATMPKSHGGSAAGSLVACRSPVHVAGARTAAGRARRSRPRAAARGRRPTPRRRRASRDWPRTATRPRRSRRCRSSWRRAFRCRIGRRAAGRHARGSENSRPPVMPDGRRISIVAMTVPRMMSVVPCGRSSLKPTSTPCSDWLRNESSAAHDERADDRAPEARRAADDEHRERQERELEIDRRPS